jgi:hypothetical protein
MSLLFFGSEYEDFPINVGANSFSANQALYRSAYSRASVLVATGAWPSSGYIGTTFTGQTSFWVTGRVGTSTTVSSANIFFVLGDTAGGTNAANARLRLKCNSAAPSTIILEKWDGASTATTLGTSTATITGSVGYRLDVAVDSYGSSGRVRVYLDQVLIIDTGLAVNIAAGGSTSLNVAYFSTLRSSSVDTGWSEVVVADEDTRPLGVKTLVPNATGDTTAWTSGTWQDIDDLVASDVDIAVSETAAQVLAVNCTGMPTGYGGLTVRAVKSVVYAARGASGPSKIDIGLRQSSTNGFAASQTLDTGWATYSATWTTNPITSAAFTGAEIEAIQLAYRSAT